MKDKLDKKGFSLLEVLVGVAIFMIGMIGVAALLVSTVKHNAFSGNMSEATYLAESKLEDLMELPGTHTDLTDKQASGLSSHGLGGLNSVGDLADGSETSLGKNKKFSLYWNIAENEPLENSKTIKVIAQWDIKGNTRQISLQAIRLVGAGFSADAAGATGAGSDDSTGSTGSDDSTGSTGSDWMSTGSTGSDDSTGSTGSDDSTGSTGSDDSTVGTGSDDSTGSTGSGGILDFFEVDLG